MLCPTVLRQAILVYASLHSGWHGDSSNLAATCGGVSMGTTCIAADGLTFMGYLSSVLNWTLIKLSIYADRQMTPERNQGVQ